MPRVAAKWALLATAERLQRSSHCLSVLDGQAWIFGGEVQPRQPTDSQIDTLAVEPRKDSTLTTTDLAVDQLPTPRVGSAMAALGDALYLFSGRGGLAMAPLEEHGAVWRYTPTQSRWELIKPATPDVPYPPGRSYHAMASDGDETLYVHAGCPEKGRLSDLWSFDVKSRAWTELEAAPSPPRGGTSIAISNGILYRMNGFDGTSEQGGAIDMYDVRSRNWSTFTFAPDGVSGPSPRSVSALLALRIAGRPSLVTLFGEHDPSSLGHAGAGKMLSDVWAFDLENKTWSKVESGDGAGPVSRGWFDADVVMGPGGEQMVVIHGGLAEDNSRLGDVWRLEIV